jgi:DNA (cytosine-5)-methyltransferase 1
MSKREKYNVVSLFSGAMGLDLGLERAGFDVRVAVENDKHCCNTIRANTDIPVLEEDINNVTSEAILEKAGLKKNEVFLVAGGPPCQAFSTAGKRKSLEDFRGNVIVNFLRVVEELKPRYFILENVRGLLSSKLGRLPEEYGGVYDGVSDDPGSVAFFLVQEFGKIGYNTSFSLFDAANYGVPQKRERVLMFGALGNKKVTLPSPTHTQDGLVTGRKHISIRQVLKGLKERDMHYIELSEKHKKYLKHLKTGQYWKHLPKQLVEEAMGKSYYLQGGKTGFYRRLDWKKPSPTLVTSPSMPATMLCHPDKLRPLSIEEYSRIQEFPDNWKLAGSLRVQYKQVGNAVPVGLGYMAGKTVLDFHEGNVINQNTATHSRYNNTSDVEMMAKFSQAKLVS